MFKAPILALSVLCIGTLFTACKTSVDTVQRENPVSTPDYIRDERVVTDKSLAKSLGVISVSEAQVSGNLLKVQATLQNTKRSDQTFHYNFSWIRQDGMEQAAPANSWRTITLKGGEIRSVSGVAPSPQVVDFRLSLQEK
jgi:Predicted periplasmic lipoprotein